MSNEVGQTKMGVVEEETYHGGLPAAGRHRGPRGVRRERKQERIHRRDALRLRSGSPLRCDRERREEAEEAKEALRQAPFDKLRVCASLRQGVRWSFDRGGKEEDAL